MKKELTLIWKMKCMEMFHAPLLLLEKEPEDEVTKFINKTQSISAAAD